MSDTGKRDKGIALFKKLTEGQERPAKAVRAALPEQFTRYTMEHLFGDVWQGEELTLQQRSLITCTILVALNREADPPATPRRAPGTHWPPPASRRSARRG